MSRCESHGGSRQWRSRAEPDMTILNRSQVEKSHSNTISQSPALFRSVDGEIFKASAIRMRLRIERLRSPRSMRPIWLRSIPVV
jgi:hypothetical protein